MKKSQKKLDKNPKKCDKKRALSINPMKNLYLEDYSDFEQKNSSSVPSSPYQERVSYDMSFGEKPEWSEYYYKGAENYVRNFRDIYPDLRETPMRVSYVLPELSKTLDGDFVVGSVVHSEKKEEEEEALTNKTVLFDTLPQEAAVPLFYEKNKLQLHRPPLRKNATWMEGVSVFSEETLRQALQDFQQRGIDQVRMVIPNERNGRGQTVIDFREDTPESTQEKMYAILGNNALETTGVVLMENLKPIALEGMEKDCVLQLSFIRKNLPNGQKMYYLSVANPSDTSAYLGAINIATLDHIEHLFSPQALEQIEKVLEIQKFPSEIREQILANMDIFWKESDNIIDQLPGKSHFRINTEITLGRNHKNQLTLGFTDNNIRIGGASHGAIESLRELQKNPHQKISLSRVNKKVGSLQELQQENELHPLFENPLHCYPLKGEEGYIQIYAGKMNQEDLEKERLLQSAKKIIFEPSLRVETEKEEMQKKVVRLLGN